MSDESQKDPIEEIEKRRAARKEARSCAYREQLAKDLEALDALEVEIGDESVVRIDVAEERYSPGLPTMALFRLPSGAEAKRYKDTIAPRGDKKGDPVGAAELLALACRKYPEHETFKALCEKFAFISTNGAVQCVKAAEGKADAEGKA